MVNEGNMKYKSAERKTRAAAHLGQKGLDGRHSRVPRQGRRSPGTIQVKSTAIAPVRAIVHAFVVECEHDWR